MKKLMMEMERGRDENNNRERPTEIFRNVLQGPSTVCFQGLFDFSIGTYSCVFLPPNDTEGAEI